MKDSLGTLRKKRSSSYSVLEEDFESVRFSPLQNQTLDKTGDSSEDEISVRPPNQYYTSIDEEELQFQAPIEQGSPFQHQINEDLTPKAFQPKPKLTQDEIRTQLKNQKIWDSQIDRKERLSKTASLAANLKQVEQKNRSGDASQKLSMKPAVTIVKMSNKINKEIKEDNERKIFLLSTLQDENKGQNFLTELQVELIRRGEGLVSPLQIIAYVIFLIMISSLSLSQYNNQDIFYLGNQMKTILQHEHFPEEFAPVEGKNLEDILTVKDMHQWLQGVFYPIVYGGATYDDRHKGQFFGVTNKLGVARIGTNRVQRQDCKISRIKYTKVEPLCYPKLEKTNQDLQDFGLGKVYKYNRVDSEGDYTSLKTLRSYPAASHNVFLPREEGENCTLEIAYVKEGQPFPDECPAAKLIWDLQQNNFIDEATRSIYIDFNIHHPQLDKIVIARIFFEQKSSGGAIVYVDVDAFKSKPIGSGFEYFLNIAIFVQTIIYCLVELAEMFKFWRKKHILLYFSEFTNLAHLANLILLLYEFVAKIQIMFAVSKIMPKEVILEAEQYYDFHTVEEMIKFNSSLVSFNVLLTYLLAFKYLSFSSSFALIAKTIAKARRTLVNFVVSMFVILMGFSLAFMQGFGAKIEEFRNFPESMYALFRAMLMDLSLSPLRKANLWLGPLLSCLFEAFAIFVLLNVFIAIILDGYQNTKESLSSDESQLRELSTWDWIWLLKRHVEHRIHSIPVIGVYIARKQQVFPISTIIQNYNEEEMQSVFGVSQR